MLFSHLFKTLFLLTLTCSLLACSGNMNQEQDAESGAGDVPGRSNIVFILADDLGIGDVGAYGQKKIRTPQLDRMAAGGMRFTQFYAGATVCAPSRSVIMTGRHTGHTFIRGNKEVQPEGQYPLADSIVTLAERLRQAGYVTGAFGKWGLGAPGSEGDPVNQGFDRFYGYNCQRLAHHYYPYYLWDNTEKVLLPANEERQEGAYAPDLIHEQALQFIEDHRDEPFFLFYPHITPHAELKAPADSILESYLGRFPETPYAGVDDGERYRLGPYGSAEYPRATFAAMVTRLDQQVGEVLARLEALNIADNTLVIFSSDNGPHLEGGADPDFFDSNGPYRGYKRDLYEGGIRVPTLAWWPGHIQAGRDNDHVGAFWDLLPTFCELAGAGIPANIDGHSLIPTLIGQGEQPTHDYLYWEFHEQGGKQAVRMGDWKGVRLNVRENPDSPIELYYLPDDPGETTDVAGLHPEIIAEMARLMEEARTPSEVFSFR